VQSLYCIVSYCVALQSFVNQFQLAKDQLTAAGAVVADRATAAAQDISSHATRISLKVELKAPVIIIPQNSQSSNAVVVDLGQLTVSNALQLTGAGQKTADGLPPLLDLMSVELDKLMLSRYNFASLHFTTPCCQDFMPACIFRPPPNVVWPEASVQKNPGFFKKA